MPAENLHSRGVSEIIDAAFALYRQNFSQYVLVTALASAPGLITQLIFTGGTPPASFADLLRFVPGILVNMITMNFMSAMVHKAGSQVYLGGEMDLPTTVRHVAPKMGWLILAALMFGFMIGVGLLLILVGALFVMVRFFAMSQVIVLEDKNAFDAFQRSLKLTRGEGMQWHVFKTLALLYLIYFILNMVAVGMSKMISFVPGQLMLQTAYIIVAYPVVGLSTMLLYYDLRIRSEAFDLEQMTAALPMAHAASVGGASA